MPRKGNHLQKTYGKCQKNIGILSKIWILGNLGFNRYAVLLHVITAIFRKRILLESQTSKHGHSEQCTMLVDFQAKELQSIYMS